MILQLKNELARVANEVDAAFSCRSHPEFEDAAQQFDFARPAINLLPIQAYKQQISDGGTMRYDFVFELYFLTKFAKSDTLEQNKDILIDQMESLSQAYFFELNKNELLYFINPFWSWNNQVIRQYLSNLTCGVKSAITIDTACNRVPNPIAFEFNFDAPLT